MSDTFVPLVPANVPTRDTTFKSFDVKIAPKANGASATHAPAHDACAKPTVTLQRNGDIVSAIRIQCGCGQVIELTCVY